MSAASLMDTTPDPPPGASANAQVPPLMGGHFSSTLTSFALSNTSDKSSLLSESVLLTDSLKGSREIEGGRGDNVSPTKKTKKGISTLSPLLQSPSRNFFSVLDPDISIDENEDEKRSSSQKFSKDFTSVNVNHAVSEKKRSDLSPSKFSDKKSSSLPVSPSLSPQVPGEILVGLVCFTENRNRPTTLVWSGGKFYRLPFGFLVNPPRLLAPVVFSTDHLVADRRVGIDQVVTFVAAFVRLANESDAPPPVSGFFTSGGTKKLVFNWNPENQFQKPLKTSFFTDSLPDNHGIVLNSPFEVVFGGGARFWFQPNPFPLSKKILSSQLSL